MAVNLAIIISVREYTMAQDNLPVYKKDADTINYILAKTGKYDEIIYIHEKSSSTKIKEKFTDFIAYNKSKKVDEFFLFYRSW